MVSILKKNISTLCIVCRKHIKSDGSLFCRTCFNKPLFVKIRAFQKSNEFKAGWLYNTKNYGRLPTKEQRENEKFLSSEDFKSEEAL